MASLMFSLTLSTCKMLPYVAPRSLYCVKCPVFIIICWELQLCPCSGVVLVFEKDFGCMSNLVCAYARWVDKISLRRRWRLHITEVNVALPCIEGS
ncbi:hypothetical protein F4808DRAFT_420083 [Astrocystis sublimbata]|nr:hypothetical protein F4808DRAFT_420083 [Astrocystis sublimbata]